MKFHTTAIISSTSTSFPPVKYTDTALRSNSYHIAKLRCRDLTITLLVKLIIRITSSDYTTFMTFSWSAN
jgi:hypothetical protein